MTISVRGEAKLNCGQFDVVLKGDQPSHVRAAGAKSGGVAVKRVIDYRNRDFRHVTARLELEDGKFFYGNYALNTDGSRASQAIGRMANTVEEVVPANLREFLL